MDEVTHQGGSLLNVPIHKLIAEYESLLNE
jgi:hypothetical protein